jgi:hypothetical protein
MASRSVILFDFRSRRVVVADDDCAASNESIREAAAIQRAQRTTSNPVARLLSAPADNTSWIRRTRVGRLGGLVRRR